jgi:hypothetical protein
MLWARPMASRIQPTRWPRRCWTMRAPSSAAGIPNSGPRAMKSATNCCGGTRPATASPIVADPSSHTRPHAVHAARTQTRGAGSSCLTWAGRRRSCCRMRAALPTLVVVPEQRSPAPYRHRYGAGRLVRERPCPAGAAARRAERPTRVLGTIRPDPGSRWSARRPPARGLAVPAGRRPGGRGRTTLTPASVGPDGISRRVRASAERGRVQGPGRAEVDLGPRTLPVVLFSSAIRTGHPDRSAVISSPSVSPWIAPCRGPLIPPLMGPPTPPLMGPPGGGGPGVAGLGLFALVRRPASLRWSPPDRFIARRWASFVGPLRAKSWRADDWAGPTGRARIRAQSQKTNLRLRRHSHISTWRLSQGPQNRPAAPCPTAGGTCSSRGRLAIPLSLSQTAELAGDNDWAAVDDTAVPRR